MSLSYPDGIIEHPHLPRTLPGPDSRARQDAALRAYKFSGRDV